MAPVAATVNVVLLLLQTLVLLGCVVTTGAVQTGVANKRKLSIPHSSFEPSEKTRISKFIVVPVPAIVLVNSLKTLVN